MDLRARADDELGESVLAHESIAHHVEEVERFVAWCAEIVAEGEARGADEPDPPADY